MSKFTNKYNKGSKFTAKATKGATYVSLKELEAGKQVYIVRNLYINTKSKYGDAPVALINDCNLLVNLPEHLTETVREMRNDDELVSAVNNGLFGFSVYEYDGKNGHGFSVNWEDVEYNGDKLPQDEDLAF